MSTSIHQKGDPRAVMIPVALGTAVDLGDAIGITAGNAVPASSETWVTDLATTRRNFVAKFAGISAQAKDASDYLWQNGDANKLKLRVDAGGVVRAQVASGTYALGDLLGPDKDTGNALLDTTWEIVTDPREACLKVVGGEGTDPGYVYAEILSRKFPTVIIAQPAAGRLKQAVAAGGAAGNITITGITTDDEIVGVIILDRDATAANVNLIDLTSEFSITATNTINNTGGTATTGNALLVTYWDRS